MSGTVCLMTGSRGTDPADQRRLSRRLVLRGGAAFSLAWLISGCADGRPHARPGSSPGSSPSAHFPGASGASPTTAVERDIARLVRAIEDEESALNFCTAAARRFPQRKALLADAAASQRAHVTRFRKSLIRLTPPVTTTSPQVPKQVDDLEAALAQVEAALADNRSADCLSATSGPLAGLLGSAAAAHAVQVAVVLGKAAGGPPIASPRAVADVDVLAPCLAAEYAAVFGYGVVGGVLAAGVSDTPLAEAARLSYDVHRDRRDLLLEVFQAAERRPAAAEPVYDIPFRVTGPATARRLAQLIESRGAGVYRQAVASTVADGRRFALETLTDCARRAVDWGAVPVAFPGLPA
jgi:uncharacterized protein DUF4439